ncbi:MAG: aminotransferase class V-fold PLP-dependent enzyme, partial [Fibrobacter sp.]|nr:aminotransferase class V-fold PLP-dependent enzyme [Fibrobacter sp.]
KLVFEWMKEQGGVKVIQKNNEVKAELLYSFIDNSKLFKGTVAKGDRSLMNVPFVLPTDELNKEFIKKSTEAGFVNLKGHRSVGGMRASIYNAMPLEGVKKLVQFMTDFEKKHA